MARQLCRLLPLLLLCALSPASAEDAWRDDGDDANAWSAQPSWQPNPSPGATVRSEGGSLLFTVPEAGKIMKFSRPVGRFPLPFYRYLVIRYRAENLQPDAGGYFVYLNDGGPAECHALVLSDLEPDGAWHTLAVDAARLVAKPSITALAVQVVPGEKGDGRLTVDRIAFCDAIPPDARQVRPPAPSPVAAKADWKWAVPREGWTAHPDWLSNAGTNPEVLGGQEGITFRLAGAGRGMKWSCPLDGEVALKDYRFIWMRYRAEGLSQAGDYAVCVVGTARGTGEDYAQAISPGALEADGQWHTVSAEVETAAQKVATVREIAIQVQGRGSRPSMSIAELGFTNTPRRPPLGDFVTVRPGWPAAMGEMSPLDLTGMPAEPTDALRGHLGIEGWFEGEQLTIDDVPFRLRAGGKEAPRTGMLARERLAVPVDRNASEVYLLLASLFVGEEEDVRGGGTLTAIRDADRFRVRLEYADGGATECIPLDVMTHERRVAFGPRVLCAFADPSRKLARVVLDDRINHAGFALLGATLNAAAKGRLDAFRVRPAPSPTTPAAGLIAPAARPTVRRDGTRIRLENGRIVAVFDTASGLRLVRLARVVGAKPAGAEELLPGGGGPALRLTVGGKPVPPESLPVTGAVLENPTATRPQAGAALLLDGRGPAAGVRVRVRLEVADRPEVAVDAEVRNTGGQSAKIGVQDSGVAGVRVGPDAADNYYLYPQSGAVWNNIPADLSQTYCGVFPLQFMDVYNRRTGGGVYLRTEDREGVARSYTLHRSDDGLTSLGVSYPERSLAPGASRTLVRTVIGVHGGDWHAAMEAYRKSVPGPAAPRQAWFREVFNFRQRFLWGYDPLYDGTAGQFRFDVALEEGEKEFGGIDYIHLFDWGYCGKYGRIYGRTGDYSPYDYWKGGKDAFRGAIAGVQAKGVPVGLYIEGYLLEEKGKLGQARGKAWQRMDAGGNLGYWPQSTEMFICSWVPSWREVQAETYGRMVREAGVNGMYLDEFGFSSPWTDCYSPSHGHPVPGTGVIGERGLTAAVRKSIDAVKPGVALYSEECPPDVNSVYQDGSFTYSMSRARQAPSQVPLNLMRFAIPSFKTFEILVCDKPTGSWATGVFWTFFNGEGLWLEGTAREWFEPQTLDAIRKCHGILRAHKDAFAGDDVEALAPTLVDGIFANAFAAPGKRVFTLYNSHPESVAAEVIRVPHQAGRRYEDAWSGKPLTPRIVGGDAYLTVTLGPQEAGCVVVYDR